MDKTKILEVLNDWNYWNKDIIDTKKRDFYDHKIANFLKNDEIIVLKGVRRSGKSTLLINQIKQLINNKIDKEDILFVNLEDPRFINHLDVELLENIKDTYLQYLNPKSKPYIFLDEVQNIPNWEKWVNKEYELKKSNLIITGSNSSMLSSEIATTLSGRYLSCTVYPLSFKEYLGFLNINIKSMLDFVQHKIKIMRAFEEYLLYGAFPKVPFYPKEQKKDLLITYKDSILLKDIVARYKLKDFYKLEEIAAFLLSNSGIIQSINKLKNNFSISFDMASSYIEYLKNAYMIFEVKKFDYSLKKQNVNEKKYYSIDLGLSNIYRVPNLQNRGNDIESIVFLELLRRDYQVFYYKTSNDLECDFVVQKGNKIVKLIQVSTTLKTQKTKDREIAGLFKSMQELKLDEKEVKLLIIAEDQDSKIEYQNSTIEVVNILKWLLL